MIRTSFIFYLLGLILYIHFLEFLLMLFLQASQLICEQQLKQIQQMKTRSNSAPRMQTVLTPRVKDGRVADDSPQKHYYGKTAPRFNHSNHNYHYNPENSPQKPKQSKPAPANVQEIIDKKINVDGVAAQPEREAKKININEPPKGNRFNKQETIHGRKLEYPAPQRMNNIPNRPELSQNQSVQLMRSSSLSSKHFVDRSVKTAAIKSRKAQFDQKFKVAFGYLLDSNEAYLAERRRACNQKARPKDQIFRMMRPQINTTNHDEYRQKSTPYDQTIQQIVLGQEKFVEIQPQTSFIMENRAQELILQNGQRDLSSKAHFMVLRPMQYLPLYPQNHFPHHGDFEKMVPVAKFNEHPLGLPHKTNSTHRTFYKGEYTDAAPLATWNNLHPYGNNFDPNRGTTYGQHHGSKEQQPIQQWPMYDPQLIKSQGKYVTEAKGKLVDPTNHELNEPNYCECGRKVHKH